MKCILFYFFTRNNFLSGVFKCKRGTEEWKKLIQTILFNEVCNQCLAFYAFYKRKNCILTSRFHNRRVWRATEPIFFQLLLRSALRNFCTWILCITRRCAAASTWLFFFAICLTIVVVVYLKSRKLNERESRNVFWSLLLRSFVCRGTSRAYLFFTYLAQNWKAKGNEKRVDFHLILITTHITYESIIEHTHEINIKWSFKIAKTRETFFPLLILCFRPLRQKLTDFDLRFRFFFVCWIFAFSLSHGRRSKEKQTTTKEFSVQKFSTCYHENRQEKTRSKKKLSLIRSSSHHRSTSPPKSEGDYKFTIVLFFYSAFPFGFRFESRLFFSLFLLFCLPFVAWFIFSCGGPRRIRVFINPDLRNEKDGSRIFSCVICVMCNENWYPVTGNFTEKFLLQSFDRFF